MVTGRSGSSSSARSFGSHMVSVTSVSGVSRDDVYSGSGSGTHSSRSGGSGSGTHSSDGYSSDFTGISDALLVATRNINTHTQSEQSSQPTRSLLTADDLLHFSQSPSPSAPPQNQGRDDDTSLTKKSMKKSVAVTSDNNSGSHHSMSSHNSHKSSNSSSNSKISNNSIVSSPSSTSHVSPS